MILAWFIKFLSIAFVLYPTAPKATVLGYRIGDVVDTLLVVDGNQRSNPFRHQMPIFGANWIPYVRFEKSDLIEPRKNIDYDEVGSISIQFEDGFWAVPTVSLTKHDGSHNPSFLYHMTIQFVYSKSGTIHAVVLKDATYSTDHKSYFHVTYEWIEEGAVSPTLSLAIMFLLVFLFSVFSILISCGFIGHDLGSDSTSKSFERSTGSRGLALNVPKSD